MSRFFRRFGLCWALVLAGSNVDADRFLTAAEKAAIAPTADDLHAIWSERAKLADTAQFHMFSVTHKSPSSLVEPNHPLPQIGLTFDSPKERLVIAGDRLRYESMIVSLVGTKGAHSVPHFSAFNGEWQQSYALESDRPIAQQNGHRKSLKECYEWGQLSLSPIILAVRPLRREAFGADQQALRIDAEPVTLDDRPTWRVSLELSKDPPYRHDFYLEQQAPYRTLCFQGMRGEQCVTRVDIEYPKESNEEWPNWIPKTWADAWYRGQEVSSLVSHTMSAVILNADVHDKKFDLVFPTGMLSSKPARMEKKNVAGALQAAS